MGLDKFIEQCAYLASRFGRDFRKRRYVHHDHRNPAGFCKPDYAAIQGDHGHQLITIEVPTLRNLTNLYG